MSNNPAEKLYQVAEHQAAHVSDQLREIRHRRLAATALLDIQYALSDIDCWLDVASQLGVSHLLDIPTVGTA